MKELLKIGINGRPLCQNEMRGLARHTVELIKNLHELHPTLQVYIYTYGQIAPLHRGQLPFAHFRESSPPLKILWDLWILPRELKKDGVEVFHSTNNLGVPWMKLPKIVTLHDDLTHRHRMTLSLKNLWGMINYFIELYLLKKSDAIITVSRTAGQDIQRTMHIPLDKIKVIYNGVKDQKWDPSFIREDFFLYVGGLEERKNISYLIDALEAVQAVTEEKISVKLVSPKRSASSQLLLKIRNSKLQITLLENVNEATINELYQSAKALIFPSLYEGFGLPIVEAMKFGTPLLLSNIEVFKEITQGKAFYFDPHKSQSLTDLILKLESHPQEYQAFQTVHIQRSHDFSWKKMAQDTFKIYLDLVKR